jgi:hypothetical protein
MESRQTILPPPPPPFVTLRASLGALWFRATSAVHGALHHTAARSRRARPQCSAPIPAQILTPLPQAPSYSGVTLRMISRRTCPINDKWLRSTHVLGQPTAK